MDCFHPQLHSFQLKRLVYDYLNEGMNIRKIYTYVGIHNVASIIINMKMFDNHLVFYHLDMTVLGKKTELVSEIPSRGVAGLLDRQTPY